MGKMKSKIMVPKVLCPNCKMVLREETWLTECGPPYETNMSKDGETLEGLMDTVECVECRIEVQEIWKLEFTHFNYYDLENEEDWEPEKETKQ